MDSDIKVVAAPIGQSSSEARAKIHEIVEGLADLADKGNDPAISLLLDFAQFGEIVVTTKGAMSLDEIIEGLSNTKGCTDIACEEHNKQ